MPRDNVPDRRRLLDLLVEARRLGNMEVRPASEVDVLHKAIDSELEGVDPDLSQRWDDPARAARRAFVKTLFQTSERG